MSELEEKDNIEDATTRIDVDEHVENPESTSEGNANLSSTKKTENISAMPKNISPSAIEGSGDGTGPILLGNLIPDKIESQLKEMTEEFIISDAGKGSGDYTGSPKARDLDDIKIGDINTEIDLNEAKMSETDVTPKNNDNVEVELKHIDEFIDNEDEDMKLRWDDDDGSNQSLPDIKGNSEDKNDDILSEEQLLEEPSDDITNESAEMQLNEDLKGSESNLEEDILKDTSEEKDLTSNRISKDIEISNESKINPKLDVSAEKVEDKNLEDKLLDEADLNEAIKSPEIEFSAEESLDNNDITILEDKLLEETDMNIEPEANKSEDINKPLKETENAENLLLEEVYTDDQTKEDNEDNILSAESETECEPPTFKMPSLTDTVLDKVHDDISTNLLKEADSLINSRFLEKSTESSKIFSIDKNVEDSDDLLEEKLLEETESDVAMEVDDEKEGELLKDDESQDGIPTPMDIDITDPAIEDQVKTDKIINQSIIDQSGLEIKETVDPTEHVTTIDTVNLIETTDQIKAMDQSDDQANITETDIEQPIEVATNTVDTSEGMTIEEHTKTQAINEESVIGDVAIIEEKMTTEIEEKGVQQPTDDLNIAEENINEQTTVEPNTTAESDKSSEQTITVDISKDMAIEEQSQTEDVIKESVIDQVANIDEEMTTEIEEKEQSIDDLNVKEDNSNEIPSVESITTAPSDENSEQTDTLTIPETLNVNIEKSLVEKETENKVEVEKPELTTESAKTGDNLNKNADEISSDTVNPDNLDNTNDIHKDTPTDSSQFLEDSPIHIKTDHGLHKPDVMLEIPTQELIDMDDTDFSMNLDQSEVVDSTNDVEGLEHDKVDKEDLLAESETYTKCEPPIFKMPFTDTILDKVHDDSSTTFPKEADSSINTRSLEKDIEVEKTIDKVIPDDVTPSDTTTDEVLDKIDTVGDKLVDSEVETTEKIVEKIITDTENDKSESQEAIVSTPTISDIQMDVSVGENDKKAEDVVQGSVEDNMERMFADEPVAKAVEESVATTSQVLEHNLLNSQPEQPSTSTQMTPDTSDEVPEISDSLGLLAESAGRMMEDDEEIEEDEDADEDDDFDHDESSNQISAEQSEDSNPAALEAEPAGDQGDKDLTPDPKDEEFTFMCDSTQDTVEKMDVEVEEYGTLQLQAKSLSQLNEETKSAVNELLRDNTDSEQVEEPQEAPEQMDIETVKLSDTSDNEIDVEPTVVEKTVAEPRKEVEEQEEQNKSPSKSPSKSIGSPQQSPSKQNQSPSKQSPSKMKNLAITTQVGSVLNIVDLEESSSSEDDIQEVQKQPQPETTPSDKPSDPDVTNVNIPPGIEIMASGGSTSEITTKEGEVVISGVPKPPPHRPARLNTSEVSIKTVSTAEPLVIPEAKMNEQTQEAAPPKHKLSLEIFSLDSDEEDSAVKEQPQQPQETPDLESEKAREPNKCINYCCTSDSKVPYKMAEPAEVAFYDAGRDKKRRSMVCQACADVVVKRTQNLIQGIKDMAPLLELDMSKSCQELVEISDSESEDEQMSADEHTESIGEKGATFAEDNLAKFLNDTWKKYDMDNRLKETQNMLDEEIEKLEQDSKEIDAMLNDCQAATDKLRNELYATFEVRRQSLPALVIYDIPDSKYIGLEDLVTPPAASAAETVETRQAKRRLSSTSETPAKRPAIPLGYAPLDAPDSKEKAAIPAPDPKIDDDKDISVVKLSAEAAPAELPPPGEISRPPLRVGMPVYAMKNAFGPWLKGRVLEIQPKNTSVGNPFSMCRVKFDHKTKTNGKVLAARCIAYSEPADVRMTIGTRLIALFKDSNKRESYYSGVVAEIPNPVNNYRYLVFFDDGYAQYVQHQFTRLVCESSSLVWEEVHPFSREFVREYLVAYPERPMVRLHEGQHLKTEWNGKWWSSRVIRVDASLAQVMFVGDGRREWIYRGSTRLAPLYLELRAAERHRVRPMPRSKAQPRLNMPYVEYTRSDEQVANKQTDTQVQQQQQQQNEEIRRQRAVAKKSTTAPPPPTQPTIPNMDSFTSRVVYYTPKNAVRPLKLVPHRCSPKCRRSDVLSLKELRTYNPLAKPLLSGWERQIVRFKGHKEVMYRAPCGRRIRNMHELHHYLRTIDSDLPVDLFDFHYSTHCLAEFVLSRCLVGKKDLSHGKENVPVPCVNYYDDSLPEFCSYNTERTPTAGVPLNLAPEFLCGCDCTDDCQDKSKCACWKMTLEGARTIGLDGPNVGYVYKRLPEPLPSGIYECNSRCKCRRTCLNRVAQHPLQLKLQVFKTPNRGWGIRALNDVPKGSFLCVYAGNLLTDATANLDGLNEGDEYLAELDYIEVVEQMKEGYEEDIPEADKKLDKKEAKDGDDSDDDEPSSSEDEENASKTDKEDDDFMPGYIGLGVTEFNKRLRKREKTKKDKDTEKQEADEKEKEKDTNKDKDLNKDAKEPKEMNADEDCITISDDEEVREPSRFMVQDNMKANDYISKYKSVRTLFGKDEACYIMDAKVQGNIGRYLNHSCCPNVFVQNVFVDTHDPRFPWVAFFALSHIKAGTELTWNYNYDVGSVPGKVLYCYCGAANCRGRLL